MTRSLLRSCLISLMIMIISAQAVAGAIMVDCMAAANDSQQSNMHAEHAGHHGMVAASDSDAADVSADGAHAGCVLCATSCHGLSALTSDDLSDLRSQLAGPAAVPGYSFFAGHTPEPLQRPPRTVHL